MGSYGYFRNARSDYQFNGYVGMLKNIGFKQYYILIALTVVAVGAIVWFYFTPNKKLDAAASQLVETADQIRKSFANKVNYWGLSSQYVVDNNIFTNLLYSDGKLINALGKKVEIGQNENGDAVLPGERSFGIAYTDLTMGECIALSAYRFKQPDEFGLLSITIINSDTRQSFDWGEGDYSLPINRQEAKKFCKNNSTVLWTLE